jgi:hypothetical protein
LWNCEKALADAQISSDWLGGKWSDDNVKYNKNLLEAGYQILYTILKFDRGAGSLWAGSGFRVNPKTHFGLDWALVRLPEHRSTPNIVSFSFCLVLHILY